MTDEISKCSWCGKEPNEIRQDVHPGPRCSTIKRTYRCITSDCPENWIGPKTVEMWNKHQNLNMERRRKDFDAGRAGMFVDSADGDVFERDYRNFESYLKEQNEKA